MKDGNDPSPDGDAEQTTKGEDNNTLKAKEIVSAALDEEVQSVRLIDTGIEQNPKIWTLVERRFIEFHQDRGPGCLRCLMKQYRNQLGIEEVENVWQEASCLLWKYVRNNPEDGNRIENWWALYMTIANHVAFRQIARKKRERRAGDSNLTELPDENQPDPIRQIEQGERDEALRAAVRGLPSHYRRVFDRYCQLKIEGVQQLYETIATQEKLTVGAVRGILRRVMELIRESLESHQGNSHPTH